MKRAIFWLPLAVVMVVLVIMAVPLFQQHGEHVVNSNMIGQPLPEFALPPAISGRPGLASAELRRGRAHLINVFASWCVPCRTEAAQLAQLAGQGIPIEGVAVRDREQDLAVFLASYGNPFHAIGSDVDSRVQMSIGSAGVPETFVVDGRGIIRHQHIGAITNDDLPGIIAAYQEAAR
jgi:cytochrome c biogenesis protein CcmG/thiol:disulfide interchange protein DsbE